MKTFRLIRSLAASAEENMALDKKLFERYLRDGEPVFRVYGWSAPSFTYGVSQNPSESLDMERCVHDGIGVAGRMTGGGVLFHHDELTYSFVCGKRDINEAEGVLVSYRGICGFLIRFYASLGLAASFAVDSPQFAGRSAPHPLCSVSHEKFDIVIGGRKIGGNAQKRGRRAVFQHGSVPGMIDWELMRRYCRGVPEDIRAGVTCLAEQLSAVPSRDILAQKLIEAFAREFGVVFREEERAYEAGVA